MAAFLLALALLTAASAGDPPPNVMVLLADDLGVDKVAAYGLSSAEQHTPVLDGLAAQGVRFTNAWSLPNCSSTRAMLLTGRLPARHGIGTSIGWNGNGPELALDELTVAERLGAAGWATAAVGKWHLTTSAHSGLMHPVLQGFDSHEGTIDSFGGLENPAIYFAWTKSVSSPAGSVQQAVNGYVTSVNVDDALARIEQLPEPWFVYLAFNAPHVPLHKPPADLHSFDLSPPIYEAPGLHYRAAVEAMDTEIGRLLEGLGRERLGRTLLLFAGDNGDTGKGQVTDDGVAVPLIVAGAGVVAPGRVCDALVSLADVHATLVELAGLLPTPNTDAVSFLAQLHDPTAPSAREFVLTERVKPNGPPPWHERKRAVRDRRYELLRYEEQGAVVDELMYDLLFDPGQTHDVLAAGTALPPHLARAYARLVEQLAQQDRMSELTGPGPGSPSAGP